MSDVDRRCGRKKTQGHKEVHDNSPSRNGMSLRWVMRNRGWVSKHMRSSANERAGPAGKLGGNLDRYHREGTVRNMVPITSDECYEP